MSADHMLTQLLGSGAAGSFAGGLTGSLAGSLLTSKAGRKLGKRALQIGGIAAVGGLAYAAWSRYQRDRAGSGSAGPERRAAWDPGPVEAFLPPPDRPEEAETLGVTLLRAMLAAAHADGRLDGAERSAIFERVASLDLSESERAALFAQMEDPPDLATLVEAARTPEIAAEIYTASLLAIEVDTPAERGYLALLAARLGLPDALVESIHRELGVQPDAPAEAGSVSASA